MRTETLDRIHAALDGQEWTADTLNAVAAALRAEGYTIREPVNLPQEALNAALEEPTDPRDECGHDWNYTGTAYGGDDPRWHGEGRVICRKCGQDGDA